MPPATETSANRINCAAITKNGIVKLAAPPAVDLTKVTSEKKITDEEILALLELPLKSDPKKKKKAAAAKKD